jgi:hypothetical protein
MPAAAPAVSEADVLETDAASIECVGLRFVGKIELDDVDGPDVAGLENVDAIDPRAFLNSHTAVFPFSVPIKRKWQNIVSPVAVNRWLKV